MRRLLPLLLPAALFAADPSATAGLPRAARNTHYISNREPLLPSPLVRLPVGTVRPEGWLRRQLELMAEGFTGRLPEVSKFCRYEGNAWTDRSGHGEFGWEEVPYWLKGFIDLGLLLDDQRLRAESQRWIEAVLASQQPNGWFGPATNLRGFSHLENLRALDMWPNMVMMYVLRTHYEATGDARVIPFLKRYLAWQASVPLEQFLPASWQKWRGGDNLDSIYWLYNHTGEPWLLDLARVNHERTADWPGNIPTWHGVNLSQCFRAPAQYYQQSRDLRYLKATERVYDTFMALYGQAPGGLFGADENARPGFSDPRQGAETCSIVEMMNSHTVLLRITGDAKWADRAEEVAFNSLPASMTPDLKGLHYLTAPNMIQLDRSSKAPMFDNAGDMLSYNPFQYRCCQHNVAFGWPWFAENLWMGTPGNGLAAVYYAAGRVTAKVGENQTVTITEATDYPFGDTVNFTVGHAARFPLAFRIPGWCAKPSLTINGKKVAIPADHGNWITVSRDWQAGDKIELKLPMEISVRRWARNNRGLSVHRGPLAYSLKIAERWESYGPDPNWKAFEVFPASAWNYGLVLNGKDPASSFEVVKSATVPPAPQPFTPDAVPVSLRVKAKRIPAWTQERNGLVGMLQQSPVRSEMPVEQVTLIPMGAARLRISMFPEIGDASGAHNWDPEGMPVVTASEASHFWPPSAVNDSIAQTSVGDPTVPKFLWPDRTGGTAWVQYTFGAPRRFTWTEVYWVEEASIGGQHRTPLTWKLLYLDGETWRPVETELGYGSPDQRVQRIYFRAITTNALRIEAELQPKMSAGIIEWRYGRN